MIAGYVSHLEAVVPVQVFDRDGRIHQIEAIVDTGSTGFLTLPPAVVRSLGLEWVSSQIIILAGEFQIETKAYRGTILWEEEEIVVEVLEMDGKSLMGMSMMNGKEVRLQVEEGGLVEIDDL